MNIVKIKNTIFREYDVRGIYGEELDTDVAYTFGRSFGSYVQLSGEKEVLVGNDNRESGPYLSNGIIKGLIDSGVNVINLGLVTTPMYYYARKKYNIKTGIMITASHNPREYNGFKIAFDHGGNAYGEDIYKFRDYTNQGNFLSGTGKIKTIDIKEDYLDNMLNSVDLGNRKVKVVYDCGNGTGSVIVKDILKMFPNIECEFIYCDSDPTFPNHHPDPCVHANMIDLGNKVKELGYDIGIGIDGDADRVGVVDEEGNVISVDLLMAIVYRYLNNNLKNRKALFDVKCSKSLIDELESLNIEPVMYRTGASYTCMMVNSGDFDFGGEYSGHLFFRDKYQGFDDGIYAGLRIIEILSNTDKKCSELLEGMNKYYSTEELKFEANDNIKFEIVEKVKQYCEEKKYEMITLDGVRATFNDSWALIRCSNTGPNITVRFEAKTEERLSELENEFTGLLNKLLNEYK